MRFRPYLTCLLLFVTPAAAGPKERWVYVPANAQVNVLRRPGTPLVVRTEDGRRLKEGTDFEDVNDPLLGKVPWSGEYTAWHEPPDLRVHGLADGTRLRLSFFHPHIIYDGQVCLDPSLAQAAKEVKGVVGVLFTTWRQNYTELEALARELDAAGF